MCVDVSLPGCRADVCPAIMAEFSVKMALPSPPGPSSPLQNRASMVSRRTMAGLYDDRGYCAAGNSQRMYGGSEEEGFTTRAERKSVSNISESRNVGW